VSRAISILIMCLSHHLKYLIYSCWVILELW
jgi:hypothetical protein